MQSAFRSCNALSHCIKGLNLGRPFISRVLVLKAALAGEVHGLRAAAADGDNPMTVTNRQWCGDAVMNSSASATAASAAGQVQVVMHAKPSRQHRNTAKSACLKYAVIAVLRITVPEMHHNNVRVFRFCFLLNERKYLFCAT